ncbi:hypothetical protein RT99_14490 [Flavobacterium sp. MEB061]|uniref:hypothetical protein n=1 Tax=Flavobacterium sp. MEB061 TaxID=1587524 RepID=UPI0005ABC676|nr:hypothetical protein [Flavobacterium sp. MEB061]KIQ20268.1 hypothetical protein RT99_14490 [Flavobacterium sp. MEB061]
MYRELVVFRNGFKYFDKNKSWILGGLFIFSILRDYVWYACFGVNILSYSTLQDTFVSLFNYVIIFSIVPLIYMFLSLLLSRIVNNHNAVIIKVAIYFAVFILGFIYFFLFKKFVSFLFVLFFIYFIVKDYGKRNYLSIISFVTLIFIALSIFLPLMTYVHVLNHVEKAKTLEFKVSEDNMDFFSFSYNDKLYDTSSKNYYLIGNTSNYFFLFDNRIDKALVFPKSECKDIKTEVFILSNLSTK